jgi:hypothetical protein
LKYSKGNAKRKVKKSQRFEKNNLMMRVKFLEKQEQAIPKTVDGKKY